MPESLPLADRLSVKPAPTGILFDRNLLKTLSFGSMGYALFVVFEHNPSELKGWEMCGKTLAHNVEQLDAVAATLSIKTLTEMISASQEYLEASLGVEVESAIEETWFTPQEGLATINTLSAFVQAHPSQFYQTPQLLEDMKEAKHYLELAARYNVRFHLTPDF